jgi:predicted aconitase with swiveling domain
VSDPSPGRTVAGRPLAPGTARASAVVLEDPLSFWGGMGVDTGLVIDPHHPQLGAQLQGRVVFMPSGRGSSSSSSVLAEAVRLGTSPAAVVLGVADPIVAVGSIVAAELYGRRVPVVSLDASDYVSVRTGDLVTVEAGAESATVTVEDARS